MSEQKPVIPERKPTNSHWSQMAMKSMVDHLAPKGFSEIKAGVWRGKEKANIEFLEKSKVEGAGRIASQLQLHYKKRLKETYTKGLEAKREQLNKLNWSDYLPSIRIKAEISAYEEIIKELDFITIQ